MPGLSYISPKAAVRESPIQGRGLFSVAPFTKGEIVCIKGGYVFDRQTLMQLEPVLGPAEIQIATDFFIGPRERAEREGAMIFSNHSCSPNIGVQGQIVFVAMREIEAGEELTHDWAMTDDDTYQMECNCGVNSCRQIVTGQDWRRKELQEKYQGYFSSYLQQKINSEAR
jgi:SET domain-containing protein